MLQRGIVVDRHALGLQGRLHPPLPLLHHMPGFVRQMLRLSLGEVNIAALRIGQGIEPRRLVGIGVDPHVRQVHTRERFDSGLQCIGHPGPVGR